jgi:hypothetical protein
MMYRKFAFGGSLVIALFWVTLISFAGDGDDPRAALRFNHRFHLEEVGAGCADCHQAVKSKKVEDKLYPAMDICASCHDVEDKAECSTCHADPSNVQPLSGSHPDYQVFEHRRHLEEGLNCRDCHAEIEQSEQWTPDTPYLPPMSACLDCHRSRGQTTDCAACHYGKHPQPGDLNFDEWRRRHGLEAAFDPEKYQQYFEMGYCEDCHQGLNLTGEVHDPGWLFVHGDDVMSGGECFVCHEDRQECVSCHRTMLPVPHTLGDPSFANQEDGGSHKNEAEAYFEACLSCHDQGSVDPTCARCH